jgi:hypothetical protein
LQIESEILGVRNETRREQELSERLHEKLQKCKSEQEFNKQRRDEIEADKKRLQEQYVMLKTSL